MIEFTPKKMGSLGKNYLQRHWPAVGLRRRFAPAVREKITCTAVPQRVFAGAEHWALSDYKRSSQFEIWLVLRLNGAKLLQYYIYSKRRASRAARASRAKRANFRSKPPLQLAFWIEQKPPLQLTFYCVGGVNCMVPYLIIIYNIYTVKNKYI